MSSRKGKKIKVQLTSHVSNVLIPFALSEEGNYKVILNPDSGLECLLHHGHVLKFGPRSWRTKTEISAAPLQ